MQEQFNAQQSFLSMMLKQIHILSQKNEIGFKPHTWYKANCSLLYQSEQLNINEKGKVYYKYLRKKYYKRNEVHSVVSKFRIDTEGKTEQYFSSINQRKLWNDK